MSAEPRELDVAVIGAGPVGVAAGLHARRAGLSVCLFEQGALAQTIRQWPRSTVFFSESVNIEIGGHPLVSAGAKPTRNEALTYFRRVAEVEALEVATYRRVTRVLPTGEPGAPHLLEVVRTEPQAPPLPEQVPERVAARHVILATGYYGNATRLGVPGEEMPHVLGTYAEPEPFWRRPVVIVGGSNSAVEAALELYRSGARVTVVHRGKGLRENVKYWLAPDFLNRVRDGVIGLELESRVERIEPDAVQIARANGKRKRLPAEWVLRLIGYRACDELLRAAGVAFTEDSERPVLSESFETSVPGLYAVGSAGFGRDTRHIFIENGRDHAAAAVTHILSCRG